MFRKFEAEFYESFANCDNTDACRIFISLRNRSDAALYYLTIISCMYLPLDKTISARRLVRATLSHPSRFPLVFFFFFFLREARSAATELSQVSNFPLCPGRNIVDGREVIIYNPGLIGFDMPREERKRRK